MAEIGRTQRSAARGRPVSARAGRLFEQSKAEPRKHSQVTWIPVDQIAEQHVLTAREALVNYLNNDPMVCADGFKPHCRIRSRTSSAANSAEL